jgi:hypothetical protein
MFQVLIFLVIGLFVAMLFLQFYFRARVLGVYRILVNKRVHFGALDLFDREKRLEIQARYPGSATEIDTFARHLRYSIRMATVLLVLITAFGAILMYFRH